MRERRAFARIRLDVPASLLLYQVDFCHAGAIADLSLGGCYFPISHSLACEEECIIELTAGEGLETETVTLSGVIARTDAGGVGIRFTDLSEENRAALQRIMDRQGLASEK